jgi:DNA mismatch endonuclease (patch repair protein)
VGKFQRNVARDRKVLSALEGLGWTVHVIWECETRDAAALNLRLREALNLSARVA